MYDPNLSEYLGSDAFPFQLWEPESYVGRRDFFEATGVLRPQDDSQTDFDNHVEDYCNQANFMVWTSYVYQYRSQDSQLTSENVQKIMQQQDDELSKIDTPDKEHEKDHYDENHIVDSDVLERIEKRFGKALPLNRLNVILLMDMSRKHASIEQFEPFSTAQ